MFLLIRLAFSLFSTRGMPAAHHLLKNQPSQRQLLLFLQLTKASWIEINFLLVLVYITAVLHKKISGIIAKCFYWTGLLVIIIFILVTHALPRKTPQNTTRLILATSWVWLWLKGPKKAKKQQEINNYSQRKSR